MKALVIAVALLCSTYCFADTIYVQDDDGNVIPVESEDGDIDTVTHGNGKQTWIWNRGGNIDIVHPDGKTTRVFDGKYVK